MCLRVRIFAMSSRSTRREHRARGCSMYFGHPACDSEMTVATKARLCLFIHSRISFKPRLFVFVPHTFIAITTMAAQERRPQILQRLQNSFMQLLPIVKEYIRAEEAEVNDAERAERLRIAFRYQLARALERNRMVAFWNLPQDAPHFLPIPLENGQPLVLPVHVQFPATMIDLFSIRQLNETQALLRAYGLPEEGRLHELKARFFTYITNGPWLD